MQGDPRPALGPLDRLDREFSPPIRFPANGLVISEAGATRFHAYPVGDDEGRVEADAELTDQSRIFLLITGHLLQKIRSTGARNSAEVIDEFVTRHADAVIEHRKRVVIAVVLNTNTQIRVISQ